MYLNLFIYLSIGKYKEGTFLVRESSTSAGDYVLSVLHDREVIHYQIRKHGEDAFFSIGKYIMNFNNLSSFDFTINNKVFIY